MIVDRIRLQTRSLALLRGGLLWVLFLIYCVSAGASIRIGGAEAGTIRNGNFLSESLLAAERICQKIYSPYEQKCGCIREKVPTGIL